MTYIHTYLHMAECAHCNLHCMATRLPYNVWADQRALYQVHLTLLNDNHSIRYNRSHCHGNVHLHDDSKSHSSLAHDSKSCRRTWRAEWV